MQLPARARPPANCSKPAGSTSCSSRRQGGLSLDRRWPPGRVAGPVVVEVEPEAGDDATILPDETTADGEESQIADASDGISQVPTFPLVLENVGDTTVNDRALLADV
jgi:hypothetical protein